MEEVLEGLCHWTARHPKIGIEVSSYWLREPGVLFDPLVPAEGLEAFEGEREPRAVLLSNRHHLRDAPRFAERFGCSIHCNSAGLHEFAGSGVEVEGFEVGDRLPGGVIASEMDAICPDDTALYIPQLRALELADSVVRGGPVGGEGPLGFVPDPLMDEPPETKRAILASCARLLQQLEFDHLLLAHGGPVIGDGRALLAELVESGGRTAFEL